jgi:hypothetical protein
MATRRSHFDAYSRLINYANITLKLLLYGEPMMLTPGYDETLLLDVVNVVVV